MYTCLQEQLEIEYHNCNTIYVDQDNYGNFRVYYMY